MEMLKDPKSRKQFLRYLVTGFTSFGIEYTLYALLYRFAGFHYILASAIVYVFVFWFIFLVNRFWSFESKGDIKKQLAQYGVLFFFNLFAANIGLMYLFSDVMGISPYISPVLKMGFVVMWNFVIYKKIIYK